MFCGNQHNTVKQLSFNLKIDKLKKQTGGFYWGGGGGDVLPERQMALYSVEMALMLSGLWLSE